MVKKKKDYEIVYRTLKTTLHTVIRSSEHILQINNIVQTINQLRCHVQQFSKLYLIFLTKEQLNYPTIDREYFQCIIRVLTTSKLKRKDFTKSKPMYDLILSFYNEHYKDLIFDHTQIIDITGYRNIVRYMITDIVTDYENNIKMRFYDHVKNYVNAISSKNEYVEMVKKLESNTIKRKKIISIKLRLIHKTIQHLYDIFKIDEKHNWLSTDNIFPNKKFQKDSVVYDLQVCPQDYISCMINMNLFCEQNNYKIMNVFPLKRSIVPGHIRIDTKVIIDQFISSDNKKLYSSGKAGIIEQYKDQIWNEVFETNQKIFNGNKYKFNGSIQTDGFSISILQSYYQDKHQFKNDQKINKELYIDDMYTELSEKKYVCIDPNKDDLIFCASGSKETNNFQTFRYTNNQRSKETRKRKHKHILLNEKLKQSFITNQETELSKFNSKTNDFLLFKEYIKKKNEINILLKDFYERILWRKLRLSTFIRTKKSEMKMVDRFKKKFGPPEKVFIGFGDWSQKQQMRFKEPTKGKSFRTLFRKAGYKVVLLDEYNTSKKCCNCKSELKNDGICEKFLKIKSPRPWKKNTEIICNGLVKCTTCITMFNRDVNSVVNMLEMTRYALKNDGLRPKYLMCNNKSLPVKAGNNHESVSKINK